MRVVQWTIAGTVLALGLSGMAMAQSASPMAAASPELRQPGSVQTVALGYDGFYYYAQDEVTESPSDRPVVPDETPAAAPADAAPTYSYAAPRVYETGVFRRCCLGEAWTLPQPCVTQRLGLTLGGWISAGLYDNAHGAPSNGVPLGFNEPTGLNMHQLWFFAGREADTGGYGWDWGFRFDYVFGLDGPDTQAFGDESWDFGWNSSPDYGSAIPQLYAELAFNDLTVKGGRFYTPIGYEVVQAPGNFFYSHAYAHTFGEPFTHTGFLASWKQSDRWTFHGGWVAGWDTGWENRINASTFLGGIEFAATDRSTLAWFLNTGNFGTGLGDVYMNSIVWNWKLAERWTYILQHDLGMVTGRGVDNAQWYGINQYLLYQLNDCWGFGMRFEWFRDDDGTRVVVNDAGIGNAGNYYAMTAGLNWRPHRNLVFRPEVRYDSFDGNVDSGTRPFGRGDENNQFSGGFDMIFTF